MANKKPDKLLDWDEMDDYWDRQRSHQPPNPMEFSNLEVMDERMNNNTNTSKSRPKQPEKRGKSKRNRGNKKEKNGKKTSEKKKEQNVQRDHYLAPPPPTPRETSDLPATFEPYVPDRSTWHPSWLGAAQVRAESPDIVVLTPPPKTPMAPQCEKNKDESPDIIVLTPPPKAPVPAPPKENTGRLPSIEEWWPDHLKALEANRQAEEFRKLDAYYERAERLAKFFSVVPTETAPKYPCNNLDLVGYADGSGDRAESLDVVDVTPPPKTAAQMPSPTAYPECPVCRLPCPTVVNKRYDGHACARCVALFSKIVRTGSHTAAVPGCAGACPIVRPDGGSKRFGGCEQCHYRKCIADGHLNPESVRKQKRSSS